jgi:hypothetical protein
MWLATEAQSRLSDSVSKSDAERKGLLRPVPRAVQYIGHDNGKQIP